MPTIHSYNPTLLCAVINSGRLRLPLSHTRTLEVIAKLEGAKDYNTIAHRSDANLLKARAKILREEINRRIPQMRLSETDAIEAIKALSQAQVIPQPEPGHPDS